MENELLMAVGLGFARLSVLLLMGYAFYRVLTATPKRAPAKARIRYAQERLHYLRNQR